MVTFPPVIRQNEGRKKFGKYRRNATKNNYFFFSFFLARHYFCPVTPNPFLAIIKWEEFVVVVVQSTF